MAADITAMVDSKLDELMNELDNSGHTVDEVVEALNKYGFVDLASEFEEYTGTDELGGNVL